MIKTIKKKYKKFVVNLRICTTIMASLFLIFVFLGATSYLYMQSSSAITYSQESTTAYRQELEESFRQENAKHEWERLYKYHGYPAVVIYEEGKAPYFYDKQGSKCSFIYPPKGAGLINHQAEDSEYYAALRLDKDPMTK